MELRFQGDTVALTSDMMLAGIGVRSVATFAGVWRTEVREVKMTDTPEGVSLSIVLELDPCKLLCHAREFRHKIVHSPESAFPALYLQKYGVPKIEVTFPDCKYLSCHSQLIHQLMTNMLTN